ncbi:MAG: cyclic nucleotide-binding domain-containing protein [Microthrixaceae bacterium]
MTHNSELSERLAVLATMELFADFSDDQLQRVVNLSERRSFGTGDVIVDQGDTGVECFVIEEGRASVYVRGEYVATSGRGSMIGEMALVDHRPRTATVVADTDLLAMRFDSKAFRLLLEEMPKASERVFATLRERLERLSEL